MYPFCYVKKKTIFTTVLLRRYIYLRRISFGWDLNPRPSRRICLFNSMAPKSLKFITGDEFLLPPISGFLLLSYRNIWWRGVDSNYWTQREWIYSPPRLASSLPHHNGILDGIRTRNLINILRCILFIKLIVHNTIALALSLQRYLRSNGIRTHKPIQLYATIEFTAL